ncbi:MAG: DoxX family protein [Deltaproteobacteria bacterium]|nr:DoxX family protein [Deltaproteobacteria bacterium]
MNKMFCFFQILLILTFGLFGMQKVVMPIPDLIAQGMLWIEDFPAWQVRLIGALEALGALGLVLPYAIKAIPKILVPVASACLAITMIGAIITHVARQDPVPSIVITSILFGMCVAIAKNRFVDV